MWYDTVRVRVHLSTIAFRPQDDRRAIRHLGSVVHIRVLHVFLKRPSPLQNDKSEGSSATYGGKSGPVVIAPFFFLYCLLIMSMLRIFGRKRQQLTISSLK